MSCPIPEALDALRRGEMLIVVDSAERENEGDLLLAAQFASAEKLTFMMRHASGLVCVPMNAQRLAALELPEMVAANTESQQCKFTVSVDARHGTASGVSAADRARTILALLAPDTKPGDLRRPGHVFPLHAETGGVLSRPGHTEAAVDLCSLAGLSPAGVICELCADDGGMMRIPQLEEFSHRHGLKIVSIADLIAFRKRSAWEALTVLPTPFGSFDLHLYRADTHHLALVSGEVKDGALVRVHSECLTGEALLSQRWDCGPQLRQAMRAVAKEGGVLLYIRQEGRGIGLANKLRAYALQDRGLDTVQANEHLGFRPDERDYGVAAAMLADLGVRSVRLMTNNPAKISALEEAGIRVIERVPLEVRPTRTNRAYLRSKKEKLGHLLAQV